MLVRLADVMIPGTQISLPTSFEVKSLRMRGFSSE